MKKILSTLLILLFMGVSFTGCEEIKSLADVKFDTEFTADLPVVSQAEEGQLKSLNPYSYTVNKTVNPLSIENIEKYKDDIKDIQHDKVTLEVLYIDEPCVVTNVNVTVTGLGPETSGIYAMFGIGTWSISGAGASYEFTDEPNIDYLMIILKSLEEFRVEITGFADKPSISIQFQYGHKVKVTANPL